MNKPKFWTIFRNRVRWKKTANRPAGEGLVVEVQEPSPSVYHYKVSIVKPESLKGMCWVFEEGELEPVPKE